MIKYSKTRLTLTPPLRGGREGLRLFPLLLLMILLPSGCKSKKMIVGTVAESAKTGVVAQVTAAQPAYVTANVSKMNVALQAGKQRYNAPATCRIYRDSVIHLSIQPFMGIELFRLELSKENVTAFDKMNSVYYEMSYAEMTKLWGAAFDFFDIQAVVTNQLFSVGRGKEIGSHIKIVPHGESAQEIRYETEQLTQKTTVNKNYLIEKQEISAKKDNFLFKTEYKNFQNIRGVNVPHKLVLEMMTDGNAVKCEFDVTKIAFDEELKVTPTNTARYTRGSMSDLMRNLGE